MAAGRPAKYESSADLQQKVEQYFAHIKETGEAATITGIALWLGFESRQSFYDYEESEEFSYAIKRSRLKVEHEYELCLHKQSPTGAIFALKNMGWKDKSEVDQKVTGGVNISYV